MTTDELRAKFEATFPHLDFSADSYGNYYSQRTLDHLYGYRSAHASRDAEVEALRKDAERYRWLRDRVRWNPLPEETTGAVYLVATMVSSTYGDVNDQTDEAIDAAMRDDEK